MKRFWYFFVGVLMVLGGLVAQGIVVLIVVGGLCAAVANWLEIKASWWVWPVEALAAVVLNLLIYRQFRRQPAAPRVLGIAGAVSLVIRGIFRIRYGRETYAEPESAGTGFEVLPTRPPG
jgi:hypothetical protein